MILVSFGELASWAVVIKGLYWGRKAIKMYDFGEHIYESLSTL